MPHVDDKYEAANHRHRRLCPNPHLLVSRALHVGTSSMIHYCSNGCSVTGHVPCMQGENLLQQGPVQQLCEAHSFVLCNACKLEAAQLHRLHSLTVSGGSFVRADCGALSVSYCVSVKPSPSRLVAEGAAGTAHRSFLPFPSEHLPSSSSSCWVFKVFRRNLALGLGLRIAALSRPARGAQARWLNAHRDVALCDLMSFITLKSQ